MNGGAPILAAGAVCWRMVDGKARILVVRRDKYQDVSLPKGKVESGETLPETAVREIAEETGLSVALGAPLGQVEYVLPNGRDKVVYYWAAEVSEHAVESSTFVPGSEIASVGWISLSKARKRLSYPHDLDIVETFAQRLRAGKARTFALIVLRHGKAVPAGDWRGPDASRPLMKRGEDQAASIAMGIAAYRPRRILTSTAVRCAETVAPTARLVGLDVEQTDAISQDSYELRGGQVLEVAEDALANKHTSVLCSHGPVLPEIVEAIAKLTTTPVSSALRRAALLATGEYSVLHISEEHPTAGIVAIETHGPTSA